MKQTSDLRRSNVAKQGNSLGASQMQKALRLLLAMMRADKLSQVNAQSFIPANETKGQSNENENPAHTAEVSVSAITVET